MPKHTSHPSEDTTPSYLGGLILGLIVSLPIAAWLSPHSGQEVRSTIRQRGLLIRHKTTNTLSKPITALRTQISDLRGESVADLLDEGKRFARRYAESAPESGESDG